MEYALNAPPGDGVSSISFSPLDFTTLVVGSWDTTVRLYDVANNSNKLTCTLGGACLCTCFSADGAVLFAGGLDQGVYTLDLSRGGSKTLLGAHEKPVSCMQFNAASNLLFSGGWDCNVKAWDERSGSGAGGFETLGGKVYSLSTEGTLVLAATSAKQVLIYDTRSLGQPLQVRESPLRNQIRAVALSPKSCDLFVLTSTEARVAVEYIDQDPEVQKKNYAFKCHRIGNISYPINTVAFHPTQPGIFATGGCDNVVNMWDAALRKRVSQLPSYNNSIASLAFSPDGKQLAVAASYTYEEGEARAIGREDNIFIHTLQ